MLNKTQQTGFLFRASPTEMNFARYAHSLSIKGLTFWARLPDRICALNKSSNKPHQKNKPNRTHTLPKRSQQLLIGFGKSGFRSRSWTLPKEFNKCFGRQFALARQPHRRRSGLTQPLSSAQSLKNVCKEGNLNLDPGVRFSPHGLVETRNSPTSKWSPKISARPHRRNDRARLSSVAVMVNKAWNLNSH